MVIGSDQAADVVRELVRIRREDRPHLEHVRNYLSGRQAPVYIPRDARREYRWIAEQSNVNVLPLVIDTIAQSLYVEGYRTTEDGRELEAWEHWQANRMDARQTGVHRAALSYGSAYVMVLPGDRAPAWRPYSPLELTAAYADPVNDEWPQYAMTVRRVPHLKTMSGSLIDATHRYWFTVEQVDSEQPRVSLDQVDEHGVGWVPVVRYVNRFDLDGQLLGEVEPLIAMQDQINSTTFNLLMAQQFGAFRQKWVTGFDVPRDEQDRPIEPFKAAVNRLFVAEGEQTRFGEFDSTDLKGYLDSRESTLRNLSTVAQVPPHHLIGQMSNLSAEALAAAEVQQTRKVQERKALFGESHEQVLRLSAFVAGDSEAFDRDEDAQVIWRDTEARNLAATVDALGKLTQMLGVPPEVLWERIPGVTAQDVERWKGAAAAGDPLTSLASMMDELEAPPDVTMMAGDGGDNP